jgi:bleomycin hydrolase
MADDAWFDQFVYQAVILKQFLSDDLISALETEPIVLEPWDPMGTLAD